MPEQILLPFNHLKFSTKHLDGFANRLYQLLTKNPPETSLIFDLAHLEWIGHEELVFLSAVFMNIRPRRPACYKV